MDVTSPTIAVGGAVRDVLIGASAGTAVTFAVLLVTGILAEETELFGEFTAAADALLRASMGVILLTGLVLAIAWPAFLVAERTALLGALEKRAVTHPDEVPTSALRAKLAVPPGVVLARVGMVVFWIGVGLAALFLITTLLMESGEIGLFMTGGAVVVAALGWVVGLIGGRAADRQRERFESLRGGWRRDAARADAVARRRRAALPAGRLPRLLRRRGRHTARLATIGVWVVIAGFVLFYAAVFLRQPCRGCDPRYWAEPGERLIDVLATIGGGALLVFAAGALAGWLVSVGGRFLAERTLGRWIRTTSPQRVDEVELRVILALPSAGRLTATALAFAGIAALILATGMSWSEQAVESWPLSAAGAGMLLVGALVGIPAAQAQARLRNDLREHTSSGDLRDPLVAADDGDGS
ncbi:hypothetical protein [Microbacterium sp.]|uniref:hypothetical protein n=1 Tax=Microbacterium sp. TaxID=51671 RepID=UPI002811F92A|nr:hypothetical protein [Microbacterium sp.]